VREDRYGEVYGRTDGTWDWRVRAVGNHEIVATSGGQGFTERNDALDAALDEFPDVGFAEV
jgi:uncharacterized protein YegP (UPF0339 family)